MQVGKSIQISFQTETATTDEIIYFEELELDIDHRVAPNLKLTVFVSYGKTKTTLEETRTYQVEHCQQHAVTATWSAEKV